jgi:cytochrome P450
MPLPDPLAYDPLDPAALRDPYPFYAALRREAPIHELPQRGLRVVARHADVLHVLSRPELFSSAAMAAAVVRPAQWSRPREGAVPFDPEEGVSIVGTDGARHARLRGVLSRGFTPGRLAALAPRVHEIARSLAAPLLERGECEFLADFAVPLPVTVIAELLGVDPERRADFKRWSDAAMRGVFESVDEAEGAAIGEGLSEMGEYFEGVIAERRRRPGGDLVSELLRAEAEHGALSAAEVQTWIFTLLVAGSVTTTHLLANALLALLAHPAELAAVQADPGLVPGLVEEALRYDAPVQMLFRTATEDVELAGTKIPKGAVVAPLFGSANRDERVFAEPDRFDLRRRAREHLAFGHGVHFCLGAALARTEARAAFEVWLPRLRDAALAETPVPRLRSLVFRGPLRIPLSYRAT